MSTPIPDDVAAQLEQLGIRRDTYSLKPTPRIQKYIAGRLQAAAQEVPSFPLTMNVRIDALLAARKAYNGADVSGAGTKISVNDLVVKAAAQALIQMPQVNSSYTAAGIVTYANADVAVAVATDIGLVTPIVRAADTKDVAAISAEIKELSGRAKIGRLQPEEYTGGGFTVSNLGMFGITSFGSIINPPQAAILSVGAGEERPVVCDGRIEVETVMTVTMTCDHRIIDGATGAKWLAAFRALIEAPEALTAE